MSEAEHLIALHTPHIAFVDIHLQEGQLAYGIIDELLRRDARVVITSAKAVLPQRFVKAITLQKPFSGAALLAALGQSVTGTL